MTEQTAYLEILGVAKRGAKNAWSRIGTAFPTKDGKGYRLLLDYLPTDGATEIVLLPPKDRSAGDEGL